MMKKVHTRGNDVYVDLSLVMFSQKNVCVSVFCYVVT